MKTENLQKLKNLNVEKYLCYTEKRSSIFGTTIMVLWELRHYFVNGVEVAILFLEGTPFENLHIFDIPRIWDSSFLEKYKSFDC